MQEEIHSGLFEGIPAQIGKAPGPGPIHSSDQAPSLNLGLGRRYDGKEGIFTLPLSAPSPLFSPDDRPGYDLLEPLR
jgi:hypothetical protein